MSFKVVCGLFSQAVIVSSNIILEASRGGNPRLPVPMTGNAMDVTRSSSALRMQLFTMARSI